MACGYVTRLAMAALIVLMPGMATRVESARAGQAGSQSEIVVRGHRGDPIHAFVTKVARPEPGRQLARWGQPICLEVRGIAPAYETAIVDRLHEVVSPLDVRIAGPHCVTNLAIVLSHNVEQIVRAMLDEYPPRFGDLGSDQFVHAKRARQLLAPRTIRWFAGVIAVGENGAVMSRRGSKFNATTVASRIRTAVHEEVVQVTILIDADQLGGMTLGQFTDYLVFVALANPDMAADYSGTDSILSALPASATGTAPSGMTTLDLAYLAALYGTPADRQTQEQIASIENRLKRGAPQR